MERRPRFFGFTPDRVTHGDVRRVNRGSPKSRQHVAVGVQRDDGRRRVDVGKRVSGGQIGGLSKSGRTQRRIRRLRVGAVDSGAGHPCNVYAHLHARPPIELPSQTLCTCVPSVSTT